MMTPEITKLSNGLTVVSLAMPGVETAAVALNADVGARHESEIENGLAHLFEHMVFKGTRSRSARAIAEAIEDVGGSLNAWTSRDSTVFHARILGADLPLAVELVGELVMDPRFDEDDLVKEREVVLSEIGEALETPDDLVFDNLQTVAFPGQALGRPILGTAASLAGLDRAALLRWRDDKYRGPGLVLAAAGQVDHDRLVGQAQAMFSTIPHEARAVAEPARWGGGLLPDGKHGEQLHVALAFSGPDALAPGYYAAQLFATALGGGMSSRLFQELREERGLAYSVSASHAPHSDIGVLSLYFASRPKDGPAALAQLRDVAQATARTLDKAELARAKAQIKAGILMGLEGCGGQSDWLGRSILTFGRILPPAEAVAAIEAATLDDVRRIGIEMLASAPALAAVGPGADRLAA